MIVYSIHVKVKSFLTSLGGPPFQSILQPKRPTKAYILLHLALRYIFFLFVTMDTMKIWLSTNIIRGRQHNSLELIRFCPRRSPLTSLAPQICARWRISPPGGRKAHGCVLLYMSTLLLLAAQLLPVSVTPHFQRAVLWLPLLILASGSHYLSRCPTFVSSPLAVILEIQCLLTLRMLGSE